MTFGASGSITTRCVAGAVSKRVGRVSIVRTTITAAATATTTIEVPTVNRARPVTFDAGERGAELGEVRNGFDRRRMRVEQLVELFGTDHRNAPRRRWSTAVPRLM